MPGAIRPIPPWPRPRLGRWCPPIWNAPTCAARRPMPPPPRSRPSRRAARRCWTSSASSARAGRGAGWPRHRHRHLPRRAGEIFRHRQPGERARRRWRDARAASRTGGWTPPRRVPRARDAGRADAPMRAAPDAVVLDTTARRQRCVCSRAGNRQGEAALELLLARQHHGADCREQSDAEQRQVRAGRRVEPRQHEAAGRLRRRPADRADAPHARCRGSGQFRRARQGERRSAPLSSRPTYGGEHDTGAIDPRSGSPTPIACAIVPMKNARATPVRSAMRPAHRRAAGGRGAEQEPIGGTRVGPWPRPRAI